MADDIRGIPVALPPADLWLTEPGPSGDAPDGMVLSIDPATGTLNWKRPEITGGPSTLTQNISLIGNQANWLYGPVRYDEYGMRRELAAYIPGGVWDLDGHLIIQGKTGFTYHIVITQGHVMSADPGRVGVISEAPADIGYSAFTWDGPSNILKTVPIGCYGMQYFGPKGTACEIAVKIIPEGSGAAGAVIAGNAFCPSGNASMFNIRRLRGR